MLVEHPVALARADANLKKDIPWISVSAVGMFEGCLADIQRIGLMSEVDIFWTSNGLTCFMWVFKMKTIRYSATTILNGFTQHKISGCFLLQHLVSTAYKQSILSKICLRAHYCLCIVQLLLSCLLKNNWRLIAWLQLMKQQFKDKNLDFDKMLCLFFARWPGVMKVKNDRKWPTIFFIFLSLITRWISRR
jgi:hypothetical protein